MVGVLDFCDKPPESGLGGKLVTLPSPRGGWGNELMLTVFRNVLPALLIPAIPDTARGWGSAVVGGGVAGGRCVVDGARRPDLGVACANLDAGVGKPPVLLRVLPTGRAGRAMVGGPFDGRDGLGRVADMV